MKNRKLRTILSLALICALALSTPLSVSAKSKKIGKPEYPSASAMFIDETEEACQGKTCLGTYCKGAKKCEFYRATSAKGKYKKVATVKNGNIKYIKSKSGLTFFKVKGVNGKKKGKFSKVFSTYNANIKIEECIANYTDNSITIKIFVDNSKGKNTMTFINSNDYISTEIALSNEEIKELYKDKNLIYDDEEESYYYVEEDGNSYVDNWQSQFLKGKLVDENGTEISSTTIGKNKTGYVYTKYTYDQVYDEEESEYYVNKQIEYAKKVLDYSLYNASAEGSFMSMTKWFKVKSGSKSYKLGITFCNSGEGLRGWISNYPGVN